MKRGLVEFSVLGKFPEKMWDDGRRVRVTDGVSFCGFLVCLVGESGGKERDREGEFVDVCVT